MSNSQSSAEIWAQIIDSYRRSLHREPELQDVDGLIDEFGNNSDRIDYLRRALKIPGVERGAALYCLNRLGAIDASNVLRDIVELAILSEGYAGALINIINKVPREYLLKQLVVILDELLQRNPEEDVYRKALVLTHGISIELRNRYMTQALESHDDMIQAVAREFIPEHDL